MTGIILAAGLSKRMGKQKLLMPVKGMPLVERVISVVSTSKVDEIILVYHDEGVKAIGDKHGLNTVYNPNPQEGQTASLKLGLQKASPVSDGFVFFVGDQPLLDAACINKLIDAFYFHKDCIIVPDYQGQKGNPVIFPSTLRKELLQLEGDTGGREIIKRMPEKVIQIYIDDDKHGKDMDTWEAYMEIEGWEIEKSNE
ncbi:MAG: molybdenum cofactor cytidylyltransferase [Bacillota bacterium]